MQSMGGNKKKPKGETTDPKKYLAIDDILRCYNIEHNVEFIEFEQ